MFSWGGCWGERYAILLSALVDGLRALAQGEGGDAVILCDHDIPAPAQVDQRQVHSIRTLADHLHRAVLRHQPVAGIAQDGDRNPVFPGDALRDPCHRAGVRVNIDRHSQSSRISMAVCACRQVIIPCQPSGNNTYGYSRQAFWQKPGNCSAAGSSGARYSPVSRTAKKHPRSGSRVMLFVCFVCGRASVFRAVDPESFGAFLPQRINEQNPPCPFSAGNGPRHP